MTIIKQNPASRRLPDFRNLGVMLRLLLGVNLLALAAALVQAPDLLTWPLLFVELGVWVQPLLLCSLLLLAGLRDLLWRLGYAAAVGMVLVLVAGQAALLADFWRFMGFVDGAWPFVLRAALLAAITAGIMLFYFHLRAGALSPALSEARLQALTARIRPHFLFNSLNAVLSLIRAEPKRAEHALEELAELFRALMRDNRELVPLADEIALCRQYLDLEKLRLGERLKVVWQIDDLPGELLVPPLMLQPLLENAVYHGVEPSETAGEIRIGFLRKGEELFVSLENPVIAGGSHQAGNRMALANIRERLALHYDLEARLEAREEEGIYKVTMVLPCRN
jgi:two-component system sensor histidine kinase AlgZ